VTESHDDRTPVEHDPTGMRALLANLPDPGPMPDDLVARITAALSAEVRGDAGVDAGATASATPSPTAAHASTATVVPLARRRFGLKHLGVAAAVVAALGLGGVVLSTTPNALTAAIGAGDGSDSQAGSAGRAEDQGADSAAPGPMVALVPPAGSGQVVVVMSGRSYAVADLAAGARALAAAPGAPLPTLAAESPGIGPIGTPLGARSCATTLGVPADAGLLVDVAEVDGRPAAVLVADTAAGRSAYAVERSCTTGTTGIVSGPVGLG
jgi:hypothetical protein